MSTYRPHSDNGAVTGTELAGKYLLLLTLIACLIGIVGTSYWSYDQTARAFRVMNDPDFRFLGWNLSGSVAHFLSLVFQYGQNPSFWFFLLYLNSWWDQYEASKRLTGERRNVERLRRRALGTGLMAIAWFLLFMLFALVDAGTNLIQVNTKVYASVLIQTVMQIVSIACVFVEEFMMKVVTSMLTVFNDILEEHGFQRIGLVDATARAMTPAPRVDTRPATSTHTLPKSVPPVNRVPPTPKPHIIPGTRPQPKEPTYTNFGSRYDL